MGNDNAVLVLKHLSCEPPGLIGEALAARGLRFRMIESPLGEPVPIAPAGHAALVVTGGPMGVCDGDRCPFLRAEAALIERFLQARLPVLGVCLGNQLLAHVLGSEVTPGPKKELGWLPIHSTPEGNADPLFRHVGESLTVTHWHGDRFDLPSGAVHLASSELTPIQAFRYGRSAYGVLCHLELTEEILAEWRAAFAEEAGAEGYDVHRLTGEVAVHLAAAQRVAQAMLGAWADLAVAV